MSNNTANETVTKEQQERILLAKKMGFTPSQIIETTVTKKGKQTNDTLEVAKHRETIKQTMTSKGNNLSFITMKKVTRKVKDKDGKVTETVGVIDENKTVKGFVEDTKDGYATVHVFRLYKDTFTCRESSIKYLDVK